MANGEPVQCKIPTVASAPQIHIWVAWIVSVGSLLLVVQQLYVLCDVSTAPWGLSQCIACMGVGHH